MPRTLSVVIPGYDEKATILDERRRVLFARGLAGLAALTAACAALGSTLFLVVVLLPAASVRAL